MIRRAMLDEELGQRMEYIVRVQSSLDDNGHAPPGPNSSITTRHAELPHALSSIHDEVIGPVDVIGPARPQTDAGSVEVEPQPAPCGCFCGTFSPSRRSDRCALTRLAFTCQPSVLSKAVIRRLPDLPYSAGPSGRSRPRSAYDHQSLSTGSRAGLREVGLQQHRHVARRPNSRRWRCQLERLPCDRGGAVKGALAALSRASIQGQSRDRLPETAILKLQVLQTLGAGPYHGRHIPCASDSNSGLR